MKSAVTVVRWSLSHTFMHTWYNDIWQNLIVCTFLYCPLLWLETILERIDNRITYIDFTRDSVDPFNCNATGSLLSEVKVLLVSCYHFVSCTFCLIPVIVCSINSYLQQIVPLLACWFSTIFYYVCFDCINCYNDYENVWVISCCM